MPEYKDIRVYTYTYEMYTYIEVQNRIFGQSYASVIPDGVISVYFFHVQLGDLDETCNLTKNE